MKKKKNGDDEERQADRHMGEVAVRIERERKLGIDQRKRQRKLETDIKRKIVRKKGRTQREKKIQAERNY